MVTAVPMLTEDEETVGVDTASWYVTVMVTLSHCR